MVAGASSRCRAVKGSANWSRTTALRARSTSARDRRRRPCTHRLSSSARSYRRRSQQEALLRLLGRSRTRNRAARTSSSGESPACARGRFVPRLDEAVGRLCGPTRGGFGRDDAGYPGPTWLRKDVRRRANDPRPGARRQESGRDRCQPQGHPQSAGRSAEAGDPGRRDGLDGASLSRRGSRRRIRRMATCGSFDDRMSPHSTALADGSSPGSRRHAWLWSRDEAAGPSTSSSWTKPARCRWRTRSRSRGAANSLVLLGDPQQLEQPQKGTHPDGVGVSALEHVLGGAATMPAGPRAVPADHVAAASGDLRLHLGGVLRGQAGREARPRAPGAHGHGRLRRRRPVVGTRRTRRQPELVDRGGRRRGAARRPAARARARHWVDEKTASPVR